MTAAVTLDKVSCVFGSHGHEVRAVDRVDLNIEPGEFFTLLGPSGSGKTTCLRMIGGFTLPTAGRVLIGGEDMSRRPPYARPVNTVFQDYALFPHMSIRDNVAYALMVRKVGRAERHRRAEELLEQVELAGVGERRPAQLSGGQRQRVALARALINQPQVLLLDEPLGALDLKLREQMQGELKALQRRLGITFLFITHDQHEALSMSDRIGVFNQGRLEQVGTPRQVYDTPATRFVAMFVGAANVLDGEPAQRLTGQACAMLRPERIRLRGEGAARARGTVCEVQYFGAFTRVRVDAEGVELQADLPDDGESAHAAGRRRGGIALGRARRACAARRHAVNATAALQQTPAGVQRRLSDLLYTRRGLLLLALLAPPLLWFGVIYLGSLFALLANAFFGLDDFTGQVVREFTLKNFVALTEPANLDAVRRSVAMAAAVTLSCTVLAFPLAYYMARHATGAQKAMLYIAVMLPLWSSYLVRLYAWKMLLAKEGAISWLAEQGHFSWLINALLALPAIGGPSLSFSTLGTFIVFVYMWLPFMILPIQAAVERIPESTIEASGDLGANARHHAAPRDPAAGHAGHRRRLDLHLLADAGRLHHSAGHRRQHALHRPGGLHAAGRGRQRALRRGLLAGADRRRRHLSVAGQAFGSLRCALKPRRDGRCAPPPGWWSPSCTCRWR